MTSSTSAKQPEPDAEVPIASRYVRALLNRHDVPSMRHVTSVAQILGIGYTLVYRRMNGAVAWELEEIERVAAHFGESLADVFAADRREDYVSAMLIAGSLRVPCQLIPGPAVRDPQGSALVATLIGTQWVAMPAAEAAGGSCFEVKRLLVTGKGERRWRIAVLDDDAGETASLEEHFAARGCEVQGFCRVEDLIEQMKVRPFDAYVIDWVLGEGSAAELLGMIRADDKDCPIAVLTGKMKDDLLLEPAVAEAVSTYKLLFFEKPTRLPIISAQVLQALAGR